MLIDNKSLQRALKAKGLYAGEIDGDFGPNSRTAARALATGSAPSYQPGWSDERCRIAAEQQVFKEASFYTSTVDGLVGPATQVALERWQDHITFNRPSPDPAAGVSHSQVWPRQSECLAFYGSPGTNHTKITPPYPIYYGDQELHSITINKRCAESALRILEATLAHYGQPEIHRLGIDRYSGCFNNRVMRNGRTLSMHAFACAWDWDANRNTLRMNHTQAQFAKLEYAPFIDAHEAEGWISLGRARDFDWMHFQAARL